MVKVFVVLVLSLFCIGCASSKGQVSPVKLSKITAPIKSYGECKMMPNGYLVCPKSIR